MLISLLQVVKVEILLFTNLSVGHIRREQYRNISASTDFDNFLGVLTCLVYDTKSKFSKMSKGAYLMICPTGACDLHTAKHLP